MRLSLVYGALVVCALACDDDLEDRSERNPEQTGDACFDVEDCYPDADPATLRGEVICLDRVEAGYCTHRCTTDADCCAVEGECDTDLPQVCSPFESTGLMLCFLSCEPGSTGGLEASAYCREQYGDDYHCRSSGGGSENRDVCAPGGVPCADPSQCLPDVPNCCFDAGGTGRYCYTDVAADGRDCL